MFCLEKLKYIPIFAAMNECERLILMKDVYGEGIFPTK